MAWAKACWPELVKGAAWIGAWEIANRVWLGVIDMLVLWQGVDGKVTDTLVR